MSFSVLAVPSPSESAELAGLRYVSCDAPGYTRRRSGRGWIFLSPDGKPVRDPALIERIKSLVIPPAWVNVWICPNPRGHLQAVGVDAKGRRQYLYHPAYREIRDSTKYSRMGEFAAVLPVVRAQVDEHLGLPGMPREKVIAAVVRLMSATSARIGNEEYARSNDSYGLTTLRDHHVEVAGKTIRLRFRGKSGREHEIELTDRRLARIVASCQDLEGQELFQYLASDGTQCRVCSDDVNQYIRDISGAEFTAKDFRTWNGSRAAVAALRDIGPADTETAAKKNIALAVKTVAETLRNRPAICRKYYLHPAIIDAYLDQSLFSLNPEPQPGPHGLSWHEVLLRDLVVSFTGHVPQSVREKRARKAA